MLEDEEQEMTECCACFKAIPDMGADKQWCSKACRMAWYEREGIPMPKFQRYVVPENEQ